MDITRHGRKRRREGLNLIDNHEENPFDTSSDALSDIYFYFLTRQSNLHPHDYRNKVRMIGMLNLVRAAFKVLPEVRKNLEEQGIVIRQENNDL
jgi:hypothetical protein